MHQYNFVEVYFFIWSCARSIRCVLKFVFGSSNWFLDQKIGCSLSQGRNTSLAHGIESVTIQTQRTTASSVPLLEVKIKNRLPHQSLESPSAGFFKISSKEVLPQSPSSGSKPYPSLASHYLEEEPTKVLLLLEASLIQACLHTILEEEQTKVLLHILVSLSNTGPLRSCSVFKPCSQLLCLPPSLEVFRVAPWTSPCSLTTAYPRHSRLQSLDLDEWTSVFGSSEFFLVLVYRIASPDLIGFSWVRAR